MKLENPKRRMIRKSSCSVARTRTPAVVALHLHKQKYPKAWAVNCPSRIFL